MKFTYIYSSLRKFKVYIAAKIKMVNHQEIIKEVISGVDPSWVY